MRERSEGRRGRWLGRVAGIGGLLMLAVGPAAAWGQPALVRARDLLEDIAHKNAAVLTYQMAVDTSQAYAAGDQWCAMLVCSNALRVKGGALTLQTISLYMPQDSSPSITLMIASRPFRTNTLNSVWVETDLTYFGPPIPITTADYKDVGATRIASKLGLGIPIESTWTNREIYVSAIADDGSAMTGQPVISFGVFY